MGLAERERMVFGADATEGFVVEQVRCPPGNLSYVVADLASRRAAILDPEPAGADGYRRALAEHGLAVSLVIDTHTHVDHVSVSRELAAEHGCPIVMHADSQSPRATLRVSDGDELALGGSTLRVWHCPGHTRDMLVVLVCSRAFTGDTLFVGAVGRSDLPGGDHRRQWASLRRVMTLPDETLVYPGHDYAGRTYTTIGAERASNPRLQLDEEAFVADALTRLDMPFPERFEESIRANTR
jgi:sulfur dioxygenase